MSWIQNLVKRWLPPAWANAAEAETRTWVLTCGACGHTESLWDAGGVRWGGRGKSATCRACAKCKTVGWQKLMKISSTI